MRHDVVQLARDPVALVRDRARGALLTLTLEEDRPLVERLHVHAPILGPRAQQPRRRDRQLGLDRSAEPCLQARARADQHGDRDPGREREQPGSVPVDAVGDGEQRDQGADGR